MLIAPESEGSRMHARGAAVAVAVFVGIGLALAPPRVQAQSLTTLYSFCSQSGCTDGENPYHGVIQGSDGNFYGVTSNGGAKGTGTVFKFGPSGALTTLYSFCSQSGCTDGGGPAGGLVQGNDGNFYGTTSVGGANGSGGTVFKLTPSGALTTLYSFCSQSGCADGSAPIGELIQASDGNFYGATYYGGTMGIYNGTVFRITPSGVLTTLYSFCSQRDCADGQNPHAGVVQGSDGNFYGTTAYGGLGWGTVFKFTSDGTLTTLHSFGSQSGDGYTPYAGVVQGSDGNFYGTTTTEGGSGGGGTVFQITPSGTLTTLCTFCSQSGCPNGYFPEAGLIQATSGNFYGTTYAGGATGTNSGTVFQITASGALTALYSFCEYLGCPDGQNPSAGVIQGSDGSFYGTTLRGGANNEGTIFKLALGSPLAIVSPPTLTFTSQDVGTISSPQGVKLSNSVDGPLSITSIFTSGDFAQTNNCDNSAVAGGSCTIDVTFTPTGTGTRNGTLTILDESNGVNGSQQAYLSGTAINPGVRLSTTELSFGGQAIKMTSAVKTVMFESNGTTPLSFLGATLSGPNAGDFAQTNNCPANMPPKTKCTINVTFTPRNTSAESGTLYVNDNAANSPQTVALTGTGVPPASLMAASTTYSTREVGTTSSAKTFDLINNLSTTLDTITISTTGDFAVSATTCGTSLAARSNCTISVTFTPTATGTRTGTLSASDTASNSPQTVSLTGTGK